MMPWLKKHRESRSRRLGKYYLEHLLKIRDPEIYGELTKVANILAEPIARKMCMAWLDEKRINHCILCPSTDPLVKREGGGYLCKKHSDALSKPQAAA